MQEQDWLSTNLKLSINFHSPVEWNTIFATTCWWIWRWRNHEIFQREQIQANKGAFVQKQAQYFEEAWRNSREPTTTPVRRDGNRWCPPPQGWLKLNIDGTSKGNPGRAGGGGIIRDANGCWKGGFIQVTGFCDAITSEAWAFKRGIQLALSIGVMKIEVECDSRTMVSYMTDGIPRENSLYTLVKSCNDLLKLFEQVKVVFCYRECNRLADHLANLALDLPEGSQVLVDPPESCISLLAEEACLNLTM